MSENEKIWQMIIDLIGWDGLAEIIHKSVIWEMYQPIILTTACA